MNSELSQAALARALGLAKSRVTALKHQGMPTGSIEAARRWRLDNLEPARMRGFAIAPAPRADDPPPAAARPDHRRTLALELLDLAASTLDSGDDIAWMKPKLRAALAAVPARQRASMPLPVDVMSLLVADVLAQLPPKDGDPRTDDGHLVYVEDMSDADAAWLGSFWYAVAAGEIRLA